MIKREDNHRTPTADPPSASPSPLPYTIELWDRSGRRAERVIGRAASAVLARAIFTAAQSEHAGRRIVLRRGSKVMTQSD
jgi:hypothetical protein